jgi:uncharacterized protein involved in type VI secretion and phage assembly
MNLEKVVANLVQRVERRFYGKYRGFVVDNADPEQLGRLKLQIPSVLGEDVLTGWALPCVPYGGDANQGFLFIPEKGAGIWVEFEEGDLEFPIWVGTYWSKPGGESELPKPNNPDGSEQASVQNPPTRKIIKTKKGHTIQFEDADNEEIVTIVEATNGNVITLNKDGIKITDGANSQEVILDNSGISISDKNGNEIIMASGGIQVGSSGAIEPFVLGNQFMANVSSFIAALSTHTHVGNMGGPTSPPVSPMQLQVPLSTKHKVE